MRPRATPAQGRAAHQHDDRVDGFGETGPIDAAFVLLVVFVAGDDGEG